MSNEQKPMFKTCVGAPLGVAITVWAVIRLFSIITAIGYLGFLILVFTALGVSDLFAAPSDFHLVLFIIIALIVDIGFLITLVVGTSKQNYHILRTVYYYEFYAVTFEALMIPGTFYMLYEVEPEFTQPAQFICLVVIGLLILLVDVTVVLALKSKLAMMRNSELPEFKRIAVED